jgi:methionyl aminopeptidase
VMKTSQVFQIISVIFSLLDLDAYKSSSLVMHGAGFGSKISKIPYSGRLRPGTLSPTRTLPSHIMRPDYSLDGKPKNTKVRSMAWDITPTPKGDIQRMRVAGRYAREVLDIAIAAVQPGITTDAIDAIVHDACIERNCYPSPLNYHGFPKSCCTSINEIICHGIPDSTILEDGDIINIDVTVYHDGVHGDCSETVLVGNVEVQIQDLVHTSYEAWQKAIAFCGPGRRYCDIGGIIEDHVAAKGYSTVRQFCGHGINSVFHANPSVLHYRNDVRSGMMAVGHTFTIEPMICLGSADKPVKWADGWTTATSDGLPTAQFEHTLLITLDGVDLLTQKLPSSPAYFWKT